MFAISFKRSSNPNFSPFVRTNRRQATAFPFHPRKPRRSQSTCLCRNTTHPIINRRVTHHPLNNINNEVNQCTKCNQNLNLSLNFNLDQLINPNRNSTNLGLLNHHRKSNLFLRTILNRNINPLLDHCRNTTR